MTVSFLCIGLYLAEEQTAKTKRSPSSGMNCAKDALVAVLLASRIGQNGHAHDVEEVV